jgi:membrane-bound lytic murein transglycosylase D
VSRTVKFYVVQAGDTMEKIARRHGTTIQALKTENKLKDSLLHPGQKLRVSSEKPKRSNEA